MFGNERRAAIKQRAKLMGAWLCCSPIAYAQSHTTNLSSAIPIRAMSRMKMRAMREISRFAMRFSPTCWYEATASLYENAQPWILIEGGGAYWHRPARARL
jgi:hypothetical protein